MPNFAFIVRDRKLGIAQGTLIAIGRNEALEALRGHDVIQIKELESRPADATTLPGPASNPTQGGLVFLMSFGLTLFVLMHALAKPIPADFLARDCRWLAFLATAATVCVRLLGRRSAGRLDSRAAAGGVAGEAIANGAPNTPTRLLAMERQVLPSAAR